MGFWSWITGENSRKAELEKRMLAEKAIAENRPKTAVTATEKKTTISAGSRVQARSVSRNEDSELIDFSYNGSYNAPQPNLFNSHESLLSGRSSSNDSHSHSGSSGSSSWGSDFSSSSSSCDSSSSSSCCDSGGGGGCD